MKTHFLGLLLLAGVAYGQFGVPSLNWGSPSNIGPPSRPHQGYGKPPGPGRYPGPPGGPGGPGGPPGGSYPPPGGNNYPPQGGNSYHTRGDYNDDPIPPMNDGGSSYDSQQLPSKLPILAPNGVVEIYNRVVDDLIRKLESDLAKKELDPMQVVIRPTPPGPVRVPGYLQKRPFRRPGAALYRSSSPVQPPSGAIPNLTKKTSNKRGRSGVLPPETRFGESRPSADGEAASFRGSGKISKGPLEVLDDDEKEILETTAASTTSTSSTTTEAPKDELPPISISNESSEEAYLKTRSDEFFPEPEEEEEESLKDEKDKKREESEEVEEDEEKTEDKGDVDSLIQHYQNKNSKTKDKYSGKKKNSKPVVIDPSLETDIARSGEVKLEEEGEKTETEKKPAKEKKKKKNKNKKEKEQVKSEEEDDDENDDDDPEQRDDNNSDHEEFDSEPGTGGGKRPQGGYYPPGGPPAIPSKPNAEMTGLSRIRRASDVSVSVDARSAVITARLLVGPINVVINDSTEPMEKNVIAEIPELEAELLLMERHGVVFLQRFTLDRAYGQDVQISVPKSKDKKKGSSKNAPPPVDPNHPLNLESRRHTKMAAHITMEVVKLLRSGNLRVNLMRTAQGAMSKLKLPIKKAKSKKKAKKEKGEKKED